MCMRVRTFSDNLLLFLKLRPKGPAQRRANERASGPNISPGEIWWPSAHGGDCYPSPSNIIFSSYMLPFQAEVYQTLLA